MVTRAGTREPLWVGLDIGSQSLKLVQIAQTSQGVHVIKRLIQELPRPRPGQSIDRLGWLQSALRAFQATEVHLSISDPNVLVRRLTMPLMPERELCEAVKWQVKDEMPFPVSDAVLDARVTGDVWDHNIKKHDVLVAAAPRAFLQELVSMVERAGPRIASIAPSQIAAWRGVVALLPEAAQGALALIELGESQTHVTILKDGQVKVARELPIGSMSLTEALVGVVSSDTGDITIDYDKAETLKRRYGILAKTREGTTEEGIPLFHLSSLMRPILESLLTELSRLCDFYKMQLDEAGVSRVLLCGAGATMKQLQPFLADGLGATVEVFNPLARMRERPQAMEPEQVAEEGPRLVAAIGAALDHGRTLTLLPRTARRHQSSMAVPSLWRTVAIGLAMVALSIGIGLQAAIGVVQGHVQRYERERDGLMPSYEQSRQLMATANALEETAAAVQQYLDQQPLWEGLLKELSELVPSSIELTELTVMRDQERRSAPIHIRLTGRVVTAKEMGSGTLTALADALERSPLFADMELVRSELLMGESGRTDFTLEGALE